MAMFDLDFVDAVLGPAKISMREGPVNDKIDRNR